MTQLDPKYVASTRPVNRRTAAKQAFQTKTINPIAQERLTAIKARNKFGAPISEQLRLPGTASNKIPLSPWSAFGGVLSAMSAVALLLAWIQFSLTLASAGMVGLIAGLALIVYGRRQVGNHINTAAPAMILFDDASLQAFDRALEHIAPEVSDEVAARLSDFKLQVVRISRMVATSFVDENFTMEDRMYLTECVRRYLPDSLQSYLAVPQGLRSTHELEQGQTAVSLLLGQIKLMQAELTKQEEKLTKSTADNLMKQQRFLESKSKR